MTPILHISFLFLIWNFLAFSNLTAQFDSLTQILVQLEGKERISTLKQICESEDGEQVIPYLLELGFSIRQSDPAMAFNYAKRAKDLSEKYGKRLSLAKSLSRMANIYFTPKLDYDSAKWAINEALEIFERELPDEELGRAYNLAGIIHADQGYLEAGIEYFQKAESVFQQINDPCYATTIHHNIGKLYKYSGEYDKAKTCFLECLERFEANDCKRNYDYLFVNLGGMYEEDGAYEKAIECFAQSLEIAQVNEHWEGMGASHLMIGKVHQKLKDIKRAEKGYHSALEIASKFEINKLKIAAHYDLANLYLEQGKPAFAKSNIDAALKLAQETHKLVYLSTGYEMLHQYYENQGDYTNALDYYKRHIEVRDSMEASKINIRIAGFENEKKQNQIHLLNQENEIVALKLTRSRNLTYFLILVSLMGMVTTFILFRNYKHRQHLKVLAFGAQANQRMIDMERRILASVIETENRERKRFSADIHDGLGPLLSSAKLYLGEIAETSSGEQLELTKYTQEIVDAALKNAREISNNLIPASLNEMGLYESLRSFCGKIERIKDIHFSIDFNQNGHIHLNPGLEVVLYRVLTELINNTVKHADAKNVAISLIEKNGSLDITYSDNGKGFEVAETLEKSHRGMGLNNMKDRIEALHGDIQIKSFRGMGTDINIHVPV